MNDNQTSVNDAIEPELNLYTEISTSRLYEGKLFEDFVLVRPILPPLRKNVRKVEVIQFAKEFDDFQGNREEVRTFLRGYADPEALQASIEYTIN